MSFTIKLSVKADGPAKLARDLPRQVAFANALALTRTAQIAEKAIKQEMHKRFDRPTRWTLGSTRVIPATKQRQIAQVWLKDRRGQPQGKDSNTLYTQVFGGRRGRKAYETALLKAGALCSNEFTVPAQGLPLDPHGNVPIGMIKQILSQLKAAEPYSGSTQNKTDSKRSKRTVRKAGTFFVSHGKSTGNPLPRGIYQRRRLGSGWATRLVLAIVVGRPRYQIRLPLNDIGQQVADQVYDREFETAMEQAIATAR